MAPEMRPVFSATAMLRIGLITAAVIGDLVIPSESVLSSAPKLSPDVLTYFPEVNGDASLVSWAHGTNNLSLLNAAIADNAMMIEADVSVGFVTESTSTEALPIMAHPPATFSDVSLEDWIKHFLKSGLRAGIKLDFKSSGILEESLKILQKHRGEIIGPLWLNGDILEGPVNASAKPLEAKSFIHYCRHYFPGSVLSLGWTTSLPSAHDHSRPAYSWHHVIEMDKLITENHISQQLTFPVRAAFLPESYQPLKWLADAGNARSLTVWTNPADNTTVSDLLGVRAGFDKRLVFYDLPEKLRDEFWFIKETSSVPTVGPNKPEKLSPRTWVIEEKDCARTGSEAIVFFGSCLTVYMDKYLGTHDYPVTISGEIEFLANGSAVSEDSLAIGLRTQPWLWVTVTANGTLNYPAGGYTKDVVPALRASRCFKFHIVDSGGTRPVRLRLSAVTCWPWESTTVNESPSSNFEVEIPSTLGSSTIQLAFNSKGRGNKVVHSFHIYVPSGTVPLESLSLVMQVIFVPLVFFFL